MTVELFFYSLKILVCAFMIGIGMTIVVTGIGLVTGAEMLLEPSANRVTMVIGTLLAIPLCLKYLKRHKRS